MVEVREGNEHDNKHGSENIKRGGARSEVG